MVGYSYSELRQSYARLWKAMEIPPGIRVRATDSRVAAIATGKPRYDQVANATGVPWYVIGMIHEMEGGLTAFVRTARGGGGMLERICEGRGGSGSPTQIHQTPTSILFWSQLRCGLF